MHLQISSMHLQISAPALTFERNFLHASLAVITALETSDNLNSHRSMGMTVQHTSNIPSGLTFEAHYHVKSAGRCPPYHFFPGCICCICATCCSNSDDSSPNRTPTRWECLINFSAHLETHCTANRETIWWSTELLFEAWYVVRRPTPSLPRHQAPSFETLTHILQNTWQLRCCTM